MKKMDIVIYVNCTISLSKHETHYWAYTANFLNFERLIMFSA